MAVQIQLRRGTASAWTVANPILADGEMGVESDTKKFKVGDGLTAWTSLPYGGIAGQGVPEGGTTGQVIIKNSSAVNDTSWVSGYAPSESDQTIIAAQIFG